MIEAGDLLGPSATLAAVSIAVFAFAFPRALSIYNEKRAALLEADVPDPVKKQKLFILFVFGDSLLLFMTGFTSLIIGICFVILLYDTLKVHLGSSLFTLDRIIGEFGELLLTLVIVLAIMLMASLALFTTEVIIGEKKLPLLARIYARSVLGRRSSKAEVDNLVPEARLLYKKEAFWESVLHTTASLEAALKIRFNLPANVSFGRVIVNLSGELGKIVSIKELNNIRKIRNVAAHPSPERRVTKEEAETVLSQVDSIMQKLQLDMENV